MLRRYVIDLATLPPAVHATSFSQMVGLDLMFHLQQCCRCRRCKR